MSRHLEPSCGWQDWRESDGELVAPEDHQTLTISLKLTYKGTESTDVEPAAEYGFRPEELRRGWPRSHFSGRVRSGRKRQAVSR